MRKRVLYVADLRHFWLTLNDAWLPNQHSIGIGHATNLTVTLLRPQRKKILGILTLSRHYNIRDLYLARPDRSGTG